MGHEAIRGVMNMFVPVAKEIRFEIKHLAIDGNTVLTERVMYCAAVHSRNRCIARTSPLLAGCLTSGFERHIEVMVASLRLYRQCENRVHM